MSVTDPISDFLLRIRNASKAKKLRVEIPASKMKQGLAEILKKESFIHDYSIYKDATQLPRVLNGLGTAIISTSKGLMTDREARSQSAGGEVICYIW